jgi:ECF transporter S component (folate family)
LSGYFFGPIAGLLVGGIGDLLGCLLGGYAPNPILLASSCLLGLIPGLVRYIKLPKKTEKLNPYIHIVISYIICTVVCTAFVGSYGLWLMFGNGRTFWVYMGVRLSTQSVVIALNLAITILIYPMFNKIISLKKIK